MKTHGAMIACLLCLPAASVMAQTIGGGTCSSATLSGTYSLTLSGRDVNSSLAFSRVSEGIGTATFDGLSKVTFSLTTNTNPTFGAAQTLSGTYSLQANCVGVLNLTTGDTASFSLASYNSGKSFLVTGQDGTYTFTGSGSLLPTAACSASQLTGSYSFNGSGFALTSGAVAGGNDVAGLLQFDGKSALTANWSLASSGSAVVTSGTGTYALASSCVGTATLTDSSGATWTFQLVVTSANGSNFLLSAATPLAMFTGSGRTETTTAPCSVSTLTGVRSLVLTGRNLTALGVLIGTFQSVGTATFDGAGNVTISLKTNSNQMENLLEALSGTYTLGSNCMGTLNTTSGDIASFTLIAYNLGKSYAMTGGDSTYALSGSGSEQPVSCGNSSISGTYAFSGSGNTGNVGASSGSISVVDTISGLLQFDGRGDLTGSWTISTNGTGTPDNVTGQYSVTSACTGTATVTDAAGASWTVNFAATSADGSNIGFDIANLSSEYSASGHSTFTYPGLAVVNASSSVAGGTPPGSIFAIYGAGLVTGNAQQATKIPLPTTLLTTSVTVNGELAPLFYAGDAQINAQMPLDIPSGVASVVVKNGSSTSNTVAVVVPATAVPGVAIQYPANQAVVVNQNGSVNTPSSPAHVGDTVVAYFTGGGPVTIPPGTTLVTGGASPLGLSPVTESVQVMVGGQMATQVNYTGLTPTLVGCYQVNFLIPQVGVGTRNLVLTIGGTASAVTTISIAN